MNLLQSKWGQLLLPVAVFAALMAIITTMPHLTVASTGMVLLREAVLIGGSIGLMVLIVKTGPISADSWAGGAPTGVASALACCACWCRLCCPSR